MNELNRLRGMIREKIGSEQDFAERVGISKAYLSLILNGKQSMSLKVAKKIAFELNMNADEIKKVFFD